MKKILIVGAHSYIGEAFAAWVEPCAEKYQVDTVSSRDHIWEQTDFSSYDAILHVAGIAHVSAKKNLEQLYYKINTDLTIAVAKKAKAEGVKQFIFMSSIILYGGSSAINQKKVITKETCPSPVDFYGRSKQKAEEGITSLQSENFRVVCIRPPMIYGKASKGNYSKLSKLAKRCPIFPNISNERSMLHIHNLCEFIRLMIEYEEQGVFYPQNKEYVNTSQMVQVIAKVHGRQIHLTKCFNSILWLLAKKINFINKIFGSLVYEKELSSYKNWEYCVHDFEESILLTEQNT